MSHVAEALLLLVLMWATPQPLGKSVAASLKNPFFIFILCCWWQNDGSEAQVARGGNGAGTFLGDCL